MRTLIALALVATTVPALAEFDAAKYANEMYALRQATAARNAEWDAARAVERKALCDRLGNVRIGSTAAGVRASCWGAPKRVNTTQTASGVSEQWVYGTGYLYLTDGVVTAIQTAR